MDFQQFKMFKNCISNNSECSIKCSLNSSKCSKNVLLTIQNLRIFTDTNSKYLKYLFSTIQNVQKMFFSKIQN